MHPEILFLPLWAQKDLTTADSSVRSDGPERHNDTGTLRNSIQCQPVMMLNRKNKGVLFIWSFADRLPCSGMDQHCLNSWNINLYPLSN